MLGPAYNTIKFLLLQNVEGFLDEIVDALASRAPLISFCILAFRGDLRLFLPEHLQRAGRILT